MYIYMYVYIYICIHICIHAPLDFLCFMQLLPQFNEGELRLQQREFKNKTGQFYAGRLLIC